MKQNKDIENLFKELHVTIEYKGDVGHPELGFVPKNFVNMKMKDKEAGFFYFGQTPKPAGLLIAMFVLADDTNKAFPLFLEHTGFADNPGSHYYYRLGTRYRKILKDLLGLQYFAFRNRLYEAQDIQKSTIIDKTNMAIEQVGRKDTKMLVKYKQRQFTCHLSLESHNEKNTVWNYILAALREDSDSLESQLMSQKDMYEKNGQTLTLQTALREIHKLRQGFKRVYQEDYDNLIVELKANFAKVA